MQGIPSDFFFLDKTDYIKITNDKYIKICLSCLSFLDINWTVMQTLLTKNIIVKYPQATR